MNNSATGYDILNGQGDISTDFCSFSSGFFVQLFAKEAWRSFKTSGWRNMRKSCPVSGCRGFFFGSRKCSSGGAKTKTTIGGGGLWKWGRRKLLKSVVFFLGTFHDNTTPTKMQRFFPVILLSCLRLFRRSLIAPTPLDCLQTLSCVIWNGVSVLGCTLFAHLGQRHVTLRFSKNLMCSIEGVVYRLGPGEFINHCPVMESAGIFFG